MPTGSTNLYCLFVQYYALCLIPPKAPSLWSSLVYILQKDNAYGCGPFSSIWKSNQWFQIFVGRFCIILLQPLFPENQALLDIHSDLMTNFINIWPIFQTLCHLKYVSSYEHILGHIGRGSWSNSFSSQCATVLNDCDQVPLRPDRRLQRRLF